MKMLIAAIRGLFRKPRGAYVVLYDTMLDEGTPREEWYGYFDTPVDAFRQFNVAFGADPRTVNPRLAFVVGELPGRRHEF